MKRDDDVNAIDGGDLPTDCLPDEALVDLVEVIFDRVGTAFWSAVLFPFYWFRPAELREPSTELKESLYDFREEHSSVDRLLATIEWGIHHSLELGRWLTVSLAIHVPLYLAAHFCLMWMITRQSRPLVRAVPAIGLMVGVAGVGLFSKNSSRQLPNHYREVAATAFEQGDFETAMLWHKKLEQLEPRDERDAFNTSIRIAQNGNIDEAYRRMQRIAPVGGIGYLPAHLWIAQVLATERVRPESGDPQTLIKRHLDCVLQLDPSNPLGLQLLAEHQAQMGAAETALATLEQLHSADPEIELDRDMHLADIYRRTGKLALARPIWEELTTDFAQRFRANRPLTAESFLNWAGAQVYLNDRLAAIQILQRGMQRYPDNEELVSMYRRQCSDLLEAHPAADPASADIHLAALRQMIAFEPKREQVLLQVASACAIPAIRNDAQKLLNGGMGHGDLPTTVYDKLGAAALVRGDFVEARRLYQLVVERSPEQPTALNNLAWMLIHHEPTSPARALTLIDRAINVEPSLAGLQGTRGHVLIKLGRWKEAIRDLEVALNGDPKHAQLHHEALAHAYQQLGQQALATRHHDRSLAVAASPAF